MAGTRSGGEAAMRTNKRLYSEDFASLIGSKGGQWRGPKGFATNIELSREAGKLGGTNSRRGKAGVTTTKYCSYCEDNGHISRTCQKRLEAVMNRERIASKRRFDQEADDLERERMNRIARRFK
jgi:general stress protein YciG